MDLRHHRKGIIQRYFADPGVSRFFVAGLPLRVLSLFAKHLFVAARTVVHGLQSSRGARDTLIDDDRCADQHGLLSSLNMLIETAGGSEYTGADCKEWMRQADFVKINQEPLGDMHTAIIGHKTL